MEQNVCIYIHLYVYIDRNVVVKEDSPEVAGVGDP